MYHEYTKPDGSIYRKHHNGMSMREPIQLKPLDFPNGTFWQDAAMAKAEQLAERMSRAEYLAWCDSLPDQTTWRAVCEILDRKLAELDICSCRDDVAATCPACRIVIRARIGDEIPVEE